MRRIGLIVVLAWLGAVQAAALPPAAEREIGQLLAALGSSDCRFNRNGSWYAAADAQAHLAKKYDYLRKKDKLGSAEDFIVMAGSQSSSSGKAYQVQCGSAAATSSESWLRERLRQMRAVKPAG